VQAPQPKRALTFEQREEAARLLREAICGRISAVEAVRRIGAL
jgi:hypothetical protein